MTTYLGDFVAGATVDYMWDTNAVDGSSIDRATNGTLSVYKANSTTQSTAGITDTEAFDSLTGVHHIRITTASDGTFYAAGNDFMIVLSGATIDGKSVNAVVAQFSIQNRYPTVANIQSGLATAAALQTVDDLVDDLETRLTATRAGYLDNLSAGAVATASALTTVSGLVDDLEGRLTATRAGYLDNLSAGAVATASALTTVAGYIDTEVASILAAVDTEVAAIKAKTDNLPTDPADDSDIDAQLAAIAAYLDTEVAAILAAVDTEVAAIKAKTDNLPASPAAVGSAMTLAANAVSASALASDAVAEIQSGLSTLSAAQVNAEVVDALATDTYAEPSSVPAATASIAAKIGFVTAALRNKRLTTATTDTIRNDADSAAVGAATLGDDGTTFTRGEYA